MKNPGIMLALLLAAPIAVAAQQMEARGGLVNSTVDSLYVREHNGLFIETRLLPKSRRDKDLWALVRYPVPGNARGGSELTQVPSDMALRAGDKVEVYLGEGNSTISSGPIAAPARVVRLLHSDTRLAVDPVRGASRDGAN